MKPIYIIVLILLLLSATAYAQNYTTTELNCLHGRCTFKLLDGNKTVSYLSVLDYKIIASYDKAKHLTINKINLTDAELETSANNAVKAYFTKIKATPPIPTKRLEPKPLPQIILDWIRNLFS